MNTPLTILPTRPAKKYLNTDSLLEHCRDVYDLPISRITIYRAQRAGRLHPLKVGGRLLFAVADVEQWIEGGCSDAQAETEQAEG
jgi:hypothetical protein